MSTLDLLDGGGSLEPLCGSSNNMAGRIGGSIWTRCFALSCLLVIGVIAAWDAWLVVANSAIILNEQNPVCVALLRLEPESKIFFLLGKGVGTACVLSVLSWMLRSGYRYAWAITLSVASFQLGLLTYLYFADAKCGGWLDFSDCPNVNLLTLGLDGPMCCPLLM